MIIMIFRTKHFFILTLALALSIFIYWVNRAWGNTFNRSFMLSFFTFSIFCLCWIAFWELKDYWNYRWARYQMKEVSVFPFKIPINGNASLHSILIIKSSLIQKDFFSNENSIKRIQTLVRSDSYKGIILFLQGFSDDIEKVKHYTYALALAGYAVFSYDFRGVGKSRFSGLKNKFSLIIEDVNTVIDYLYSSFPIEDKSFIVVGISLGSIGALVSAFPDSRVRKVVAVAAVSNFKKNIPRYLVPFKGKWWIWLRYSFFAVDIFPNDEENLKISPIFTLKKVKEEFMKKDESGKAWKSFVNDRLRLVHCINDKIIFFHNFLELLEFTELNPHHYYVFKKGGHMFKMYETALLSAILDALEH